MTILFTKQVKKVKKNFFLGPFYDIIPEIKRRVFHAEIAENIGKRHSLPFSGCSYKCVFWGYYTRARCGHTKSWSWNDRRFTYAIYTDFAS